MFEKLSEMDERFRELTDALSQPEVIRDYPLCQQYMKEQADLRPIVEAYHRYQSVTEQLAQSRELLSDPELSQEAQAEIARLNGEQQSLVSSLRLLLVPPDPMDSRNVFMEIRAGVGGNEAALFAADLLRMYLRFTDRNSLHASILSMSETSLGGVNEALLSVTGPDAYASMKFESGVHCVKRVPVTESGGRIHTSTVTVAVLPEALDVEVSIDPADLRTDVFHASGHGGQGVNTTDSAVRLTHLPTGLVVTCQDERSQLENKAKALQVLRSRLLDRAKCAREADIASERRSQIGSGDRSERIRTYYFNHDYVVDHRIGMTIQRTANFMNGDLAPLIRALRLAEKTEKLNAVGNRE